MRLFIYIFDFGKIQGTPKRILHIQSLETQIHMNAGRLLFPEWRKYQEEEPYILCCNSFSDSGSTLRNDGRRREAARAAGGGGRRREAAGGSGRQREAARVAVAGKTKVGTFVPAAWIYSPRLNSYHPRLNSNN